MEPPYKIIPPKGKKVPILVSVPHCGMAIPKALKALFNKELIVEQDDTDFFVHHLYDFVSEMGITMIQAHYSRWVIDLNRSPENQSLYNDGRLITALCPTTNFLGQPLYQSIENQPNKEEIDCRKKLYYEPYYKAISKQLTQLKAEFGQALLWDSHSIRQRVSTIQKAPFPDLILGNNDQTTAATNLINSTLKSLGNGPFQISHNTPFKGGNITRHFGNPKEGIHALQLEMTKVLYMDDTEKVFHLKRANAIRSLLKATFKSLIEALLTKKNS